MGRDEIIRWSEVIGDLSPQDEIGEYLSSLPADEQGRLIHSYLEDEFSDLEDVSFEDPVVFEEDGEKRRGRYDCFDGNFVYEFKTKNEDVLGSEWLPLDDDVSQVRNYLEGTGADFGVVVYISRQSFEVDEYVVS